ncbi:aminoglycoside phosphotransferase family protein [Kibdelosporangium persicum]|uniref:Aminoglycoside phosphotransferase n=1 Tax=Kibdelosporangium persicum TaxID=2698649 RepID=A0ABX2F4Z4_9PSEU|nr:aminoglycoside phosphotransferase family protein [Kibdelosporangium persicum]NRN66372.1 Aminoglycoside phosphotransferase [Kibdelosporangium persicum]
MADLVVLTGVTAGDMLAAVVAEAGGKLLGWTATQVDHQPGRRTTVSYAATVSWPDGIRDEVLAASSGRLPEGAVRVSDGTTEVGVWRFPFDPDLPGLARALDPVRARVLIEATGLAVGGDVTIRTRAYRPRRRAVVEVRLPGHRRVFVKVVRPALAKELHHRHRITPTAPESLGWTDDGLVLLAGLPGRTLREKLLDHKEVDPRSVVEALDSLPWELADGERGPTWGQKAPHYAGVVGAVAPHLAPRARAIAEKVFHDRPEGPDVPVHGDFYENQLIIHNGHARLLDIDTAGRGERLDDAACLLGHLAVLAQTRPDHATHITAVHDQLEAHFADCLDPAALRRRTAAVVLSLATGPYRVQEENWLRNTELRIELAESSLP